MEILEQPNLGRLETKPRNLLQIALMELMIGENRSDDEQFKWFNEYKEKVSDIIDAAGNEEIRNLAREGKYKEAAELVREKLINEDK